MGETSCTEGQRSPISTAFCHVRSLRVRSSGLKRCVRGPTGNLNTMIELGPKLRRTPVMDVSKPVMMAPTPMIVPVPMMTPNTVRKARSLCDRMVCSASTNPLTNAWLVIMVISPRAALQSDPAGPPAAPDTPGLGSPPFDPQLGEEFWRAFVTAAGITLHVRLRQGRNTHHMLEAAFKGVARSLRDAVRVEGGGIPSTKVVAVTLKR